MIGGNSLDTYQMLWLLCHRTIYTRLSGLLFGHLDPIIMRKHYGPRHFPQFRYNIVWGIPRC
jgi:hypothetical protein